MKKNLAGTILYRFKQEQAALDERIDSNITPEDDEDWFDFLKNREWVFSGGQSRDNRETQRCNSNS